MTMRRCRKRIFCLLMVILLWSPWTPSAWSDDREPAQVLIIHSYHKGFAWTDNIVRGMNAVLTHSGPEPEIYMEYMDTKRFPPSESFAYLEEMFRRKYRRIAFEVILLSDNNALTFALSRRDALFPDVPIVFCGVNNFHMAMLDGQAAITGVAEEIDVAETISLAFRILPGVKQFVVVNDRTPTGLENLKKFQEAAAEFSDRSVSFEVLDNFTVEELQARLSSLPSDSAALVFTFHRTRDGQWLSIHEYLRLVRESCSVPIFSFWSHYLGRGVLGGALVDGEAQGKISAEYAVRILKGESADAIPVLIKSPNVTLLDHRQLRRFSIPESRLPEDSVVVFAPTGFLNRYRSAITWAISFVVALTAFTIALLVNMARRRRMEKALRQSEEKFQKAFHSCPAFMSISTLDEGRFVELNAECLRLIGSSREDVIGRKAADVGLWDKTAREPILAELKQKGHAHHKEIEIRSKTGEEYHLLWFGDVVAIGGRECLVVTGYDQTDRKRAEEELLRYRRIVSASPDAMAYIDPDYRYRIVNDAYERFSGTKREAFLGKTVPEYLGEDIFREKIKPHFDRCLVGETIKYEDWFEYPTLGRRYIQITYFPFKDDEKVVRGIVANTRDLTELKLAEEKIQQYASRLEEMVTDRTRELEKTQEELLVRERLAVLGHFAGSISHELRNPLGAIDASIYYLQMKLGAGDEKIADHLARVRTNIDRSTAIIESLLNLSRMEKPKTRPHAVTRLMSDILRAAKIPETVQTETIFPEKEVDVEVDADQIGMVIKNIVHNAVQAMEGAGTLKVSVRPYNEEGQVEIRKSDTGSGIRPENIEKVFQPLFSTKVHGIGFGLSIAKMIVENHGGTIRAESPADGGACFVIALPQGRPTRF